MNSNPIRVLLIEDDEDDLVLIRSLLAEISRDGYHMEWARDFESGLEGLNANRCDVCLLDYRPEEDTCLELLRRIGARRRPIPIIALIGRGERDVDLEAMRNGAADYLVKDQIDARILERSIRYAVERKRSEEALHESERRFQYLSSRLLTVQEDERKSIADELHDNLGQVLTAIKFGVENAVDRLDRDHPVSVSLASMIPTIQKAIGEVRSIYTGLRPSLLDDLGILATIRWFCREFRKKNPSIRVERHIDVEEEIIRKRLKDVIYRVMQEAMNNIAEHSGARRIRIYLSAREDFLNLTIEDDGAGFEVHRPSSPESFPKGLGLAGMIERTRFSGGLLEIESHIGVGTTIRARWPY